MDLATSREVPARNESDQFSVELISLMTLRYQRRLESTSTSPRQLPARYIIASLCPIEHRSRGTLRSARVLSVPLRASVLEHRPMAINVDISRTILRSQGGATNDLEGFARIATLLRLYR